MPSVKMPVRPPVDLDVWGPTIQVLSDAEMEKKIRDQDRNTRYAYSYGTIRCYMPILDVSKWLALLTTYLT